ncbi:hypothetical protein SAMN02745146_1127 [Hymenobacter daecheongensis DSM 21074]|uniref:DUF4365 domain-containing protein n=1 Tax=Hymenobacter daecheongensis DSM 21074 TaxID=1121955 RepID=A0A1M6CEU5_9BACT|nr:hypothetical protein [Hymenobacter daecheongensis]SHI59371.1 hypothetical protein SAMN02745146_1127 [Hymenobacter daecheongensis DSM 21074]
MNNEYDWSRLKPLQVGRFAEYFVKMKCALYGFDIYSSEVDDKGIDFVLRVNGESYYDIQVKSIRNSGYIFFPKWSFESRRNLYAAVVILTHGKEPDCYLIPSWAWENENALFRDRNYGDGMKSKPEWGLNISQKNMPLLREYSFANVAATLQAPVPKNG